MMLTAGMATAIAVIVALRMRRTVSRLQIQIAALQREADRGSDLAWDLRESEERARSLLDDQGDLIVRRDERGLITYVNDVYCLYAGRTRERLVGTGFDFTVVDAGAQENRDNGIVRRDEAIRTRDGVRRIEWQEVKVRGARAGLAEIQGVGRDVTARHAAECGALAARELAEAASQAKTRFLASVTHELRTPLVGIVGLADLLLETPLAPEQASYASAMKSSAHGLLSLVDEILDLSKIEAGHIGLVSEPIALAGLAETVVELLAPRAHAKNLEIAAHVSRSLPVHVTGDASRLRQVLVNLVGNAVKFTESGGISLNIEPCGEAIRFSVRDSGIGIAEEDAAALFEEFGQLGSGPGWRHGGTGLGLAISQRIVRHMGSSIHVESRLGSGACFHFTLMLPAAPGLVEPRPAIPPSGTVLVATGAPVLAEALAGMLADLGIRTEIVSSAEEVTSRVADADVSIVMADRCFGPQTFDAVLAAAEASGKRTIALLRPSERHIFPGLGDGRTSYLIKPVRAASLLAVIAGPSRPRPRTMAHSTPRPLLAGKRILLVEDNDINALIARSTLGKLGARVVWVENGEKACGAFRAQPFDAVLMDMRMPGLDGIETTRRLRAHEQETCAPRTLIIGLTANILAEDRQTCISAGMDCVLVKPLDREALVALLVPERLAAAS